ncbi:MAG: GNAT family N-acetyltransferase [Rubrobacter sp.]|nr:GNAT family N-acetyltransferase [Rubrobacter sp.]
MEVRRYRESDRKALGQVLSLAFGASQAEGEEHFDPEKNRRLDLEQVYVVEEDGKPRATATVLPLEVFVDGEPAPMGGVAAVATHPAYRRKRYAGTLMRALLADLRQGGVRLSMLDPFNHAFYRAHGYELAAEALRYTLKPTELSTSPEQRHVRAYRGEDLPRMTELNEAEAARHPICVRRGEGHWRQFESLDGSEGRETAVYSRDGVVEGYLLYRQKEGRDETSRTLGVTELVAETLRARAGLLSFAAAYDPEDWRVDYAVPPGEPLHPYLESSHVEAKVRPGMMLRLVDVEGAIAPRASRWSWRSPTRGSRRMPGSTRSARAV